MEKEKKYIIVTRVLGEMSEAAGRLWKKYAQDGQVAPVEIDGIITMINGRILSSKYWEQIISDKGNVEAAEIQKSLGLD